MSNPRQRAHRILKGSRGYLTSESVTAEPPEMVRASGSLLGQYDPGTHRPEDCLWICETGFWAFEGECEWTSYAEILDVRYPREKKDSNQELFLDLQDRGLKRIKVAGGDGNFETCTR